MEAKKMLPIGYDSFEAIRSDDFYYVDKTGLIKELLASKAQVTLFTRPRRFGKSLNMSMLASFFSLDGNKLIFDGLAISKEKDLCERYMGKYPVIFLSLKDIEGDTYQEAYQVMADLITDVAGQFNFLSDSEKLDKSDKGRYEKLLSDNMRKNTLTGSLKLLSKLLEKHYGRKVVLLIDEYDVPLARAHANGYYDKMVSLMRSMLGAALKTNTSLEFAVLTGCLRISKESIFTGLNNLKVFSITNTTFHEFFGFTNQEVRELLQYYGLDAHYAAVQKWYDGYHFGNEDIYCPWDVINYCFDVRHDPGLSPQNYWINTSGNDVIKRFVAMADDKTREEIETLVAGGTIEKDIREDLTYSEIYDTIDNLWSLLYTTGYLTLQGRTDEGLLRLRIPNLEVRDVYVKQIREYFKESVKKDSGTLEAFCSALQSGDADAVEGLFAQYLERSISIRDSAVPNERKESFYHGVMLGVLMANSRMSVVSNREAGNGYADILAKSEDGQTGIVIEMKYAGDGDLDAACRDAIGQIDERRYTDAFRYTRVRKIKKYGVGCYKKSCRVALDK